MVGSGASMHMLSRKDLNSAELDTTQVSRNPTTVITANERVQTNEKATVHVHDTDLFVKVQILEGTPAVLSLRKLCEEYGYSHEWTTNKKKTNLIKKPAEKPRQHRKMCTDRCPRIIDWFFQFDCKYLLHRQRKTRPRRRYTSSPPLGNQLRDSTKTKNTNLKRDIIPASGNRLRALPERFEEFTENLEDEGVLASRDTPANTSQDSDSERPAKVVSRKHSIFSHFPKDRNCEMRKRTKITRAPCRKRTGDAVT